MEQYFFRPYERLWKWARARPTSLGRAGGFLLFALAILATLPIIFIVGGLFAIGAAFSAIMG